MNNLKFLLWVFCQAGLVALVGGAVIYAVVTMPHPYLWVGTVVILTLTIWLLTGCIKIGRNS
jgi:hypothetical protein